LERGEDFHGHFVLYRKKIFQLSVIALSPKVIPGGRIDQLGRDPELIPAVDPENWTVV
jgi:hypothetical protein